MSFWSTEKDSVLLRPSSENRYLLTGNAAQALCRLRDLYQRILIRIESADRTSLVAENGEERPSEPPSGRQSPANSSGPAHDHTDFIDDPSGFPSGQIPGGRLVDGIRQSKLLGPKTAYPSGSPKADRVAEASSKVSRVAPRVETERVCEVCGGVRDIRVEVQVSATEADRILTDKALQAGMVVARPIVIESGPVIFAARELEVWQRRRCSSRCPGVSPPGSDGQARHRFG